MKTRKAFDPKTGNTYYLGENGRVCIDRGCFESVQDPALQERLLKLFASRKRASDAKKEKEDVMRSLGLVKVRGALGGTYWE